VGINALGVLIAVYVILKFVFLLAAWVIVGPVGLLLRLFGVDLFGAFARLVERVDFAASSVARRLERALGIEGEW
jgi:hypothetical protein